MNKWKNSSVLRLLSDYEKTRIDDPTEIIKRLARQIVFEAQSKGWSGPPYDIFELAAIQGYNLVPSEFVREARIIPNKSKKFTIEYNPFKPESRTRFSIAHEIAHTLFSDCHEQIRYRSMPPENDSWELELLCNIAASELLIPLGEFSNDILNNDLKPDSVFKLSNKYKASVEAVLHRYIELSQKSVGFAIASYDNNSQNFKIDYIKTSKNTNLKLRNGYIIPKKSNVYECLKPGWTSIEKINWEQNSGENFSITVIGLNQLKFSMKPRVAILFDNSNEVPSFNNNFETVYGDATEPRGEGMKIIGQIVNTSAATGAGFGKALVKKYPIIKKELNHWKKSGKLKLGATNFIMTSEDTYIFQMVAQKGIHKKYGEIPLKYHSLQKGLRLLKELAEKIEASVHLPLIGAGQAMGDWNVIEQMIFQELSKNDIKVTIYKLPGNKPIKRQTQPSLF